MSIEYGANTMANCLIEFWRWNRTNKRFKKPTYQEYLASPEWKELSKEAKIKVGYHCQLCNAGGELHVHHRSYDNLHTEIEANDLIVLCASCHKEFHHV